MRADMERKARTSLSRIQGVKLPVEISTWQQVVSGMLADHVVSHY
jgi:hypothetical protein